MNRTLLLFAFIITLIYSSCTPDEISFTQDSIDLRFSKDTVLFDTVLTGIGSITQRLKVFNDEEKAVNLNLELGSGDQSSYQILVNGQEGFSFEDITLLGNDSLLILVSAFIDPTDESNPFIIDDSLVFNTNGNIQSVKMVAYGQNANYLNDSILACNTVWDSPKPYVIFNSVLIDSLCTLTIKPGVRIYSHSGSTIFIKGSIKSEGDAENKIVFTNDRFDEPFDNAPGQWGGIFFLPGSNENVFTNSIIRNAQYGIWLGTPDNDTIPDLILDRVRIENISRTGIITFTSEIRAENVLINNCAEFCVGNFGGGVYDYNHCTFANFGFLFFRDQPIVAATDALELDDGSQISADLIFRMKNSIVWGDLQEELFFSGSGGNLSEVNIQASLLRTTQTELDINGNIINSDPMFVDPFDYNYRVDSISSVIDAGINTGVLMDLDNVERDQNPDIGAYEYISNE